MKVPKILQLQLRLLQMRNCGIEFTIEATPEAASLSQEEQAEQILNLLDKLEEVK